MISRAWAMLAMRHDGSELPGASVSASAFHACEKLRSLTKMAE
jgi:hypothetical protein